MDAIECERGAAECCAGSYRCTPAAACVEALQDGRLRRLLLFDLSLFAPCVIEGAATSASAAAYRIAAEGVAMHGTVFLTAPASGHFDVAFGAGHPPFVGSFAGFQDLCEKLGECFNAERRRIRGEGY